MANPSLAVDRRSRRRRNLVLLLIVAIVVSLVALAVRYRTERRQTTDYLAVAEDVADQELEMAVSLSDLFTALGDVERQDILARLDALSVQAVAVESQLESAIVARPIAEANGYLKVAVTSWRGAVDGLDDAILTVLDSEDDNPAGEVALSRSFELLRVGDQAYRQFLIVIDGLEDGLASRDFPDIEYVAEEEEPIFDAVFVAGRLRGIRKLDETHDVAVTANTNPEPFGDQNGVPVVPLSETFTVTAVITNEGNVGEQEITVEMQLISSDAESEPVSASHLIPFLEPGEARAIPFEQLHLVPGQLYELRLVASITSDGDVEDNTFEMPFLTNEDE